MTDTWNAQGEGQWKIDSNWSENAVPTIDDTVVVPQGDALIGEAEGTIGSLFVTDTGQVGLISKSASLQVQQGVTIDSGLSVEDGARLSILGGLFIGKTGVVGVGGGGKIFAQSLHDSGGSVHVGGGTLVIQGKAPAAYDGNYTVDTGGHLKFKGGGPTSVAKDGTVIVTGFGSNIEGLNDLASVAGSLSLSGGQSVKFAGALSDSGTVSINNSNSGGHVATVTVAGSLTNTGIFSAFSGTAHDTITVLSLDNAASGRLSLDGESATKLVLEVSHGGSSAGEIDLFKAAVLLVNQSFTDSGTLNFNEGGKVEVGGTFVDSGPIGGPYRFQIDTGALLELGATEAGSGTVNFSGTGGTLELKSPAAFAGSIAGFAAGDILDLAGKQVASVQHTGGELIVNLKSGQTEEFGLTGSAKGFQLKSDGHGGTDIIGLDHATKPATAEFAMLTHDDLSDQYFAGSAHHYGASIDVLA